MTTQATRAKTENDRPFEMDFDIATIKHLGLQMYSTLPPVIGELVANAWDANATEVEITIPEERIKDHSKIIIKDNGIGMSDSDLREKYLIVGRDRRESENTEWTPEPHKRPIMGRKGIGKFSAFGIAKEIEIESVRKDKVSHFVMDYDEMLESTQQLESDQRPRAEFPSLAPTGDVSQGTTITLRRITKFRTRRIPLASLRRGLARRFSVIGEQQQFEVIINGKPISVEERDLKRLLAKDVDGKPYLWEYDEVEIEPGTGWSVTGWIGALERTTPDADDVDRGISILARGKLVQEPFMFNAVVGQQYALSYLVGELHAEFVDEAEDTIGTSRNVLVWDTDANAKLLEWGEQQVKDIAHKWAEKRQEDNVRKLKENKLYQRFKERAKDIGNRRALQLADKLVRQAIDKAPTADVGELESVIKTSLDFLEFNAFWEIAQDLANSDVQNVPKLLSLFKEWEIVEAKEMSRVTEGRIKTIEKLEYLIEKNALEVPTLHKFLKEFPWVIDPRWTLVADEVRYSDLLKEEYPDDKLDEKDRRIDFLCVREGGNLVVVEIKRPKKKASKKELDQINEYVTFLRAHMKEQPPDPEWGIKSVVGYLLCGGLVNDSMVRVKQEMLEDTQIYVRPYSDLLRMVREMHKEFLDRYKELKERVKA